MNFLETLVNKSLINRYQIDEIIQQTTKEEKSIEQVLGEMGISDTDILSAKSDYFGVKKMVIDYEEVSDSIVKRIPEESAQLFLCHYQIYICRWQNI